VIGITGALSGGIEGIIIVLMHRKARKHGNRVPEFKLGKKTGIGLFLILLFILGIIYQILQMIK